MLYNIIDTVKSHPKFNDKKLKSIKTKYSKVVDSMPAGLPSFDTLFNTNMLEPGKSYICTIPVKYLYSDNMYNRIADLNLPRAITSIERAEGFSYNHAATLVAFLRPDGKIVLTQGNHRSAMAFLTQGEDAEVIVSLRVHSSKNLDECIVIEAGDFITDCSERWNITQNHRFKGGYYAGIKRYVDLHNLGKECKVAIGGVSDGFVPKKNFKSYTYFEKALEIDNTPDKKYALECLTVLSNNLREKEIKGFCYVGLVYFRIYFDNRLKLIEKANPVTYSFDDFVHYVFNEKRVNGGNGDLVNQHFITKESGTEKCEAYYASKFVKYFNEYAGKRNLKIKGYKLQGKYAIPDSCEEWQKYYMAVEESARRKISIVTD